MPYELIELVELPIDDFQPLLVESRQQGFDFVDRLVANYQSGANRFDRPGEKLFAAYDSGRLIGVGGLNRDPYLTDGDTGRVRHLYVLDRCRRQGVGAALMARIISEARLSFRRLTLRTFTAEADRFYRALGFLTEPEIEGATHYLDLSS
jgi:GNAT superfamily N-acetyltransferase